MTFARLLLPLLAGLALAPSVIAGDVPAEMTARGTIRIAIIPNYPPMEFKDPASGSLSGFDVDLGKAIAAKLGLKAEWAETSFDQMISSLDSGRVDAILSGMTDLASRHDKATFVDYLRSGPQFFVLKSRAAEFAELTALCGKNVGASRRTSFPKEIAAWSVAHCAANPIKFIGTEGSADARTQLRQGRIDAAVQGGETLPYVMSLEPDVYQPLGKPISYQFTGLALPVGVPKLHQAVAEALDGLIADGTYRKALETWHLGEFGVEKAVINGGQ